MKVEMRNALRALSDGRVPYAVIRSLPSTPPDPNRDVDLLVDTDFMVETKTILIRLDFKLARTQKPDTGFYLKKLTRNGLLTFHIQGEIFYFAGENRFDVALSDEVIRSAAVLDGCYYASDELNSYLVAGKIKYEGKQLNPKYNKILKRYPLGTSRDEIIRAFDNFVQGHSIEIQKSRTKGRTILIRGSKLIYRVLANLRGTHNISVHGVDGTGKTSTVNKLQGRVGNGFHVQYMGQRMWKTPLARRAFGTDRSHKWEKLKTPFRPIILYIEMWYRILYRSRYGGVRLFDRYPSEFFLLMHGVRRFVYKLLFYYSFPRPKYCVYLTCDSKTSIGRKDDLDLLLDEETMLKRKRIYDDFFLNQENVIVIKTDDEDEDGVVDSILDQLPNGLAKFL